MLLQGGAVFHTMLSLRGGGSASAPVAVSTYGRGKAVIDGAGGSGYAGIEVANGGSYLRFRNLELRNWGDGEGIYVLAGSHLTFDGIDAHDQRHGLWDSGNGAGSTDVTVTNSRFATNGKGVALAVNNLASTGWTYENDEFTNAGDSCIIDLAGHSVYRDVSVHHCGYNTAISYGKHGFYMKGPDITLSGGAVYDVYEGPGGGSCISPRQGGVIEDVQVHDCRTGIGWFDFTRAASQTLVIRRTAVWGVLDTGIYVDFVGANSENGANVAHHSVTFQLSNDTIDTTNAGGSPVLGVAFASPQSGYRSTATFENNVVTGNQGTSVALEFYKHGGDVSYSGRHNVYWNTGGRTQINAAGRWLTSLAGLANETGSTIADPRLKNASYSGIDLRLKRRNSPAVDFGVANPVTGAMAATCNADVTSFCGAAPDAGAMEVGAAH